MEGCHFYYPDSAETCRNTQSGRDVKRSRGEKTKAMMSWANQKNYAAEDLDAAARAYASGAKISRVCNEYPGVPDRTIRYRENLLKKQRGATKAWAVTNPGRETGGVAVTGWSECKRTACHSIARQCQKKENEMYRAKYGMMRSTGFLAIR